MNFKDLQYSIGRLTTDVRSHMARNNPLQKQDTKALSMWIYNERNNLATMRTLAYQQSETIKVFQQWTKEELLNDKEENGRDIEDIGDKLVKLLEKQTEIEQQYAAKYQQYRHAIKSIRDREDRLSDIREKKRTLSSRITNLTKTSPKSPKLRELQKELASLDRDTHDTELEMGDFKRFALKEAFYLRFNAMNEYAEKTAMIAGFGKYIVDLLDIAPTPATESTRRTYDKGIEAAMIFADAINAVEAWQPQEGDERPTIAANMSKHQGTDATREDEEISVDSGKGKQPQGTDPSSPQSVSPPRLPPRSPVPSHEQPDASVSSGNMSPQRQATRDDLDQLDLYDGPPPAYQPNQVNEQEQGQSEKERLEQERLEKERLEQERLKQEQLEQDRLKQEQLEQDRLKQEQLEQDRLKQEQLEQDRLKQVKQEQDRLKQEQLEQDRLKQEKLEQDRLEQDRLKQEQQEQKHQQEQQLEDKATASPHNSAEPTNVQDTNQPIPDIEEPSSPSLPPAPSLTHARPIAHEDKEQVDEDGFESPYQSHTAIINSTPSTPQYQQSPLPMHQYQGSPSPQPYHHNNSSMNWSVPYGGVEPKYHHGQYQQLYDQLTERQQQKPVQRPYSEFQQQYMRKDAGGFRVPTNDTPALSADKEKRLLAERYAMEETQARKASIQTSHQDHKPLPDTSSGSQKKSVILPEGDNHGYKPSQRK